MLEPGGMSRVSGLFDSWIGKYQPYHTKPFEICPQLQLLVRFSLYWACCPLWLPWSYLNCEKQGYQEVSLPLDTSIYFSKFFQLLATVCLFCFFSFFSSHTLSLSFLSVLQFIFPPPCHFSATSSFALYGYLSRYNCKILTFVVK